jgi:DNA-binding XRE family transcriptional regulator
MTSVDDPFYQAVGKRVHGFRVTKGLTQSELGLRLTPPVTRASIANLENGRQRLLLHTAVQISEIVGCELVDLIPGSSVATEPKVQADVAQELRKHKIPNQAQTRISRQFMVPGRKDKR